MRFLGADRQNRTLICCQKENGKVACIEEDSRLHMGDVNRNVCVHARSHWLWTEDIF